jgi:hypothetical protein
MIEKTQVDGQPATVVYLDKDFNRVLPDDAMMVKVVFDDGRVVFGLANQNVKASVELDIETAVDELLSYGTSEGVKKEWDTRGRGRNIDVKQSEADKETLQSWGYDLNKEQSLRESDEFGELLDRNPDRFTGVVSRGTVMSERDVEELKKNRELSLTMHSSATAKANDEFAQISATGMRDRLGKGNVPVVLELNVRNQADVGKEIFGNKGMEVILRKGTAINLDKISRATIYDGDGTAFQGYRIYGSQK